MANMSPKKIPMPEQHPLTRSHNFDEVTLGYTAEMAIEEADRCLNCKNPQCVKGCPVNIQIPDFIKALKEDNLDSQEKSFVKQVCYHLFVVEFVHRKDNARVNVY